MLLKVKFISQKMPPFCWRYVLLSDTLKEKIQEEKDFPVRLSHMGGMHHHGSKREASSSREMCHSGEE
jgi:hypothetical protein